MRVIDYKRKVMLMQSNLAWFLIKLYEMATIQCDVSSVNHAYNHVHMITILADLY